MVSLLLAGGVALIVSLVGTPALIGSLKARGIGQQIREDGPSGHVTITGQPPSSEGVCSVAPDGSIVFTPAAGFSGIVECAYTITVGGIPSAPATVTITVTPLAGPKKRPT